MKGKNIYCVEIKLTFAQGSTFSFGSLASRQQSPGSSVFGGSGFSALAAQGNAKSPSVFGGGVNMSSSCAIISSSQAAAALRSFYFAVHPDRFGALPEVRRQNERSLQVFNGYLNDLLSLNKPPVTRPIHFFVAAKGNRGLKKIELRLTESNPTLLIKAALEACSLCTKESAAVKSATKSFNGYSGAAPEAHGFSFELRKKRRLLHCHSNSLAEFLSQQRSSVLEAAEKFRKTFDSLQDDINCLKDKTGLIDIIWSVSWAMTHMRRSLLAVRRLIDNSNDDLERVCGALKGYSLRKVVNLQLTSVDGVASHMIPTQVGVALLTEMLHYPSFTLRHRCGNMRWCWIGAGIFEG
ncbi:unnamed protein product [Enterobius vermicularis]|uniref:DUF4460 domain-containing protein n=1 Tax=Enterobius vermicularis TaxID=51028 RepID=A0A0N4V9X7_ENTVE|nr:unnamed protein product [Enterobius vermicularis]